MKDIVIHVLDHVCKEHGRDPEAVKLIELAKTFGTVETLDSALSSEKAKSQVVINNLKIQHEKELAEKDAKIADLERYSVTPEEFEVVKVIRKKSEAEKAEADAAIAKRDEQLKAIQVENENRAATIRALYGF